jgi:hypothetical protein
MGQKCPKIVETIKSCYCMSSVLQDCPKLASRQEEWTHNLGPDIFPFLTDLVDQDMS